MVLTSNGTNSLDEMTCGSKKVRNGIYDGSKSRSYLKNQNLISFFKKMVCNLQQASDSLELLQRRHMMSMYYLKGVGQLV